ncbi:phosphopantetheine-binding protein [Bacillus sp. REN10]|uniref:phosphopantetheine-binding protein n=1 Tax=Bacillus sp. REN10 TaxID=2782541 RepID=UPI00193BECE2|nr:phosphopantetheine-binding protein [Bacillus sp. REN10]
MNDINKLLYQAKKRVQLTNSLKKLIIEALDLDIALDFITDDQPIFGRGLGLDSIDALELFIALEDKYGVTIYDDDVEVFSSINKLADYIEKHAKEEE